MYYVVLFDAHSLSLWYEGRTLCLVLLQHNVFTQAVTNHVIRCWNFMSLWEQCVMFWVCNLDTVIRFVYFI